MNLAAAPLFSSANKLLEAYHAALSPLCRETGLPHMAVDILMFLANNPEYSTAMDVCRCRGWKPGIVSVHVDRLVNEGLLLRQGVPGDRRKTRLVCTPAAAGMITRGRAIQTEFARRLLDGLSQEEISTFCACLAVIGRNTDAIRKTGL